MILTRVCARRSLFGSHLDVHAGGIDLKFPHHCNEVAQCEAFHGSQQWGNYFIHVGHLHIAGLKMSKSLKNFVSIQDYLKKYTGTPPFLMTVRGSSSAQPPHFLLSLQAGNSGSFACCMAMANRSTTRKSTCNTR